MALANNIIRHAPDADLWWMRKFDSQAEWYAQARKEYNERMWMQRSSIQSFEHPSNQGRISQPTRTRGAE